MDLDILLAFLAFWGFLYLLRNKLRKIKNVEIDLFVLLIRSHKINKLISNLAIKFRIIWEYITPLIIISGVILMLFGTYFLVYNLILFFFNPGSAAPIQPLIPGITLTFDTLIYMIIPIIIIVITHELSHGVMARINNLKIKSAGIILFLFIPGAFVEIDESGMREMKAKRKLSIFGAGSFTNMILAVLALLILLNYSFIISPFYIKSNGILVTSIVPNSPAYGNLKQWDIIYDINGTTFHNLTDFYNYMNNVKPGDYLVINTTRGVIGIVAGEHPQNSSKGFIGITPFMLYKPRSPFIFLGYVLPYVLYVIINWMWILGINVAIFNMLPVTPLDGDKFIRSLLESSKKIKDEKISVIHNVLRFLFLILLILNILFTFILGKMIPL